MSSGGTLQVHLQENEQHYEYPTRLQVRVSCH